MNAPWPVSEADRVNPAVESDFEVLRTVVRLVRDLRAKSNVLTKVRLAMTVSSEDSQTASAVDRHRDLLARLANAELLEANLDLPQPPGTSVAVAEALRVYVDFRQGAAEVADQVKERERLQSQRTKLLTGIRAVEAKLSRPDFADKAPPLVVQRERARREELAGQLKAVDEALKALGGNPAAGAL